MALEAEKVIPHGAEEVVNAYMTREFHEHLAQRVGSELKSFEVTGDAASGGTITTEQAMSADRLPDVAKKVVKGTVNVNITETWEAPDASGSRRADTSVVVAGIPVRVEAAQTLHARSAEETLATVRGDISVKIPLLGNKIKSAAEPYLGKFVKVQAEEVSRFIQDRS